MQVPKKIERVSARDVHPTHVLYNRSLALKTTRPLSLKCPQLNVTVTNILDDFDPLRYMKHCGKPSNRWLSFEAIATRLNRRQIKRRFCHSRSETDRLSYRAEEPITSSWRSSGSLSKNVCSQKHLRSAPKSVTSSCPVRCSISVYIVHIRPASFTQSKVMNVDDAITSIRTAPAKTSSMVHIRPATS